MRSNGPHRGIASDGVIRYKRAYGDGDSPPRSTFLTGLIPSQHGVHSFLDPKYHNNDISIRRVAAEISAVDDGVGEILKARFDASADPEYDLSKGGRSKAKRHVPDVPTAE